MKNRWKYPWEKGYEKQKFPGFDACLKMMQSHDALWQEDAFSMLEERATEFFNRFIEEFHREETDQGTKCCLIELIGAAKRPEAFEFLKQQALSENTSFQYWAIWGLKELNTKEARKFLWQQKMNGRKGFEDV